MMSFSDFVSSLPDWTLGLFLLLQNWQDAPIIVGSIVLGTILFIGFLCFVLTKFFGKFNFHQIPKSDEELIEAIEKETEKEIELQQRVQNERLKNKKVEKEKKLIKELARKEQELQKQTTQITDLPDTKPVEEPPKNLRESLAKTRNQFLQGITTLVLGEKQIDEETLDSLEESLLQADIGVKTVQKIIDVITEQNERGELKDIDKLKNSIKQIIMSVFEQPMTVQQPCQTKPQVIFIIGVNGVGKTTTIGKLASSYIQVGQKTLLGAGDTFRAGAIDQLKLWSQRSGAELVAKNTGSDPSSVIYQSVQKGMEDNYDVVICDTAGRLHNKSNLMEELKKMVRVVQKLIPDAPHDVFLVIDATTGQNAMTQAREFHQAANLTGLITTKLDGTAKGGVIIGIVNELKIPVRYIGIGEGIHDLKKFDANEFVDSLF